MWFEHTPPKPPDLTDVVFSKVLGHWYYCPTIAAIDQYLESLVTGRFSNKYRDAVLADIDRLLEERAVLEWWAVPVPNEWREALAS